jgi:hypothetical protein
MAIFSDANEKAGRPVQECEVDASSSSSGDDVVDRVNLEEDDFWKSELCSGCRQWKRRLCRGCRSWPMRQGGSVLG